MNVGNKKVNQPSENKDTMVYRVTKTANRHHVSINTISIQQLPFPEILSRLDCDPKIKLLGLRPYHQTNKCHSTKMKCTKLITYLSHTKLPYHTTTRLDMYLIINYIRIKTSTIIKHNVEIIVKLALLTI